MGLFKKKKNTPDLEDSNTLNKVVLGAIIGTAIGSAIGMASAPRPGKETRQVVKTNVDLVTQEAQEVSQLAKETAGGFYRLIKILLGFHKKK